MRLFLLAAVSLALHAADSSAFDYSLTALDGKNASLSTYKGKVLLVTIIADKSEYSGQLPKLNELYKSHQEAGLVVLGVPTSNFGGEALAAGKDLAKIYIDQYKLAFPLFAPTEVRGKKRSFLFDYFSEHAVEGVNGEVTWLFTKLLVNRAGKLVAKFDPGIAPDDPELVAAVEKTLANEELQPKKDEKKKKKEEIGEDEDSDR